MTASDVLFPWVKLSSFKSPCRRGVIASALQSAFQMEAVSPSSMRWRFTELKENDSACEIEPIPSFLIIERAVTSACIRIEEWLSRDEQCYP